MYEGGLYLGKLQFTESYPYKPPAVYMLTPSGRFKCDVKLCLSMSDFHPESWNPLWSVGSVLTGLLSFMLGTEDTVGSMSSTSEEKRAYARNSHAWNRQHKHFKLLFPDFLRESPPPPPSGTRRSVSSRGARASRGTGRLRNNNEEEGESLLSLLFWLLIFLAVIFCVFHFITKGP